MSKLDDGAPPRAPYRARVELYNLTRGSRAVGNGYMVAISKGNWGYATVYRLAGDKETAYAFAAWLNQGAEA